MQPSYPSRSFRDKSVIQLASLLVIALPLLLVGCGGTTTAPNPADTPISKTSSNNSASTSSTDTPAPPSSSLSNTDQSTPATQSSGPGPLIPADGTLKTAMRRVDEAEGMRFTLEYTSTQGIPDLDFGFKIGGIASGKLLPNRKVDFTLQMTKGNKGTKHDGEWILYWDYTDLMAYFKNGSQWQKMPENDLHEDKSSFDPTYAYNELGEMTTYGVVDPNGASDPGLIAQMAATYTLSGTELINNEAADRYHLVGESGGILDYWVSKKTGDIVKFQRDVTSNGMGTIAVLYLSDIGKPQTIETPK